MTSWNYQLTFRSPVSIFSGLAVAGLVDRMIVRNQLKLPYVPGSSVKGRWRFFAENWVRSLGDSALSHGITLHDSNNPICKDPNHACTICKLFGNPAIPSMLWVGEAELEGSLRDAFKNLLSADPNPVIHPDSELRPGIALSRTRRTSLENHLFFDEAIPKSAIFTGEILIKGTINENEKRFLIASARLVDRIGARKSIGRGLLNKGIEIQGGNQ